MSEPSFAKVTTPEGFTISFNLRYVTHFISESDTRTLKLFLLGGEMIRLSQESTAKWLAEYDIDRE